MKNILCFLFLMLFTSCAQMPWQKNDSNTKTKNAPQDYLDKIRQRLTDNVANILFCYERYGSNEILGSITIKVAINKHGAVNSVTLLKDTLKNLKVKGCVIKTVNSIMFPPHNKNKEIELIQPFNFKPTK